MPFQFEQNVESQDGNNIYLTIDEGIQSICEKHMAQAIIDNNVLNRGVCIAMDVNTGAILAMVTANGYNLNDPYTLPTDTQLKIKELPEKEQDAEESKSLAAMWRNKCVADTYMPGSVFKMCTASMALEEGKITDSSRFTCGGYMRVEDYDIGCSVTSGHGTQTFLESFCHSCNPAFIQIGQLVGIDKFRDYYTAFGFSEKSGIDLPGEADDSFWPEGEMGMVDLAVASFGQNFNITPLSMITACAAVCNGGYVLQPYVVSKITDSHGNVIKTMEKKVKRQVISNETSKKMCDMLAAYPEANGASGGYVAGYKTGGKTGTSEKIGVEKKQSSFEKDYISSFCGIAPTDDPSRRTTPTRTLRTSTSAWATTRRFRLTRRSRRLRLTALLQRLSVPAQPYSRRYPRYRIRLRLAPALFSTPRATSPKRLRCPALSAARHTRQTAWRLRQASTSATTAR